MRHHEHGDSSGEERDDSTEQLTRTADAWREGAEGTEVEEDADEVARGAERAAEQPDYGREGS